MLPQYIDKWSGGRELLEEIKAIVFIFQLREFLNVNHRVLFRCQCDFPVIVDRLDRFERSLPSLVILSKINDNEVAFFLTSIGRDEVKRIIEKYSGLWKPTLT